MATCYACSMEVLHHNMMVHCDWHIKLGDQLRVGTRQVPEPEQQTIPDFNSSILSLIRLRTQRVIPFWALLPQPPSDEPLYRLSPGAGSPEVLISYVTFTSYVNPS